jgi:hypothetical protein
MARTAASTVSPVRTTGGSRVIDWLTRWGLMVVRS